MLLRFEVSNHRSIMDPVELSMMAVDKDREAVRTFERLDDPVLTVAGIYGPNASGKSNVVAALAWLSNAVHSSLRGWDEVIPREPFRFTPGPSSPSSYEVDLVVDDVRHTYRLEVENNEVAYESLYSYPERRPRMIFEREGMDLQTRREIGPLRGTRELLTPTTLVLSAATRLDEPHISPCGRHLSYAAPIGLHGRSRGGPYGLPPHRTAAHLFTDPEDQAAVELLRFADLGINNVEITEEVDENGPSLRGRTLPRRSLHFVHRAGEEDVAFDLDDESAGTRTWFSLIGPILGVLRRGTALVVDEIDASLHPRLSARLLELFKDPETNTNGAQLIFTTHDTSLLNHLNRDEVWLTEKDEQGMTSLTALAEYGSDKVRKSLNLERAYLQGRFGAVPEPDQLVLRRALGMTQAE